MVVYHSFILIQEVFKTPIFFSFILIQTVFKMVYFEVTSSKWIRQVMVLGMFVIEVTSTLYGHILPESRQLDSRQLVVIEWTSILYVHILTDTRQLDGRLSVVLLVTSSLYGPLSTDSRLKKVFYQPGLLKIFFYQDHPCSIHLSGALCILQQQLPLLCNFDQIFPWYLRFQDSFQQQLL